MENKIFFQMISVMIENEGNVNKDVMIIQFKFILEMFRDNSIVIGYGGDFCGDYGKEGGLFYKWLFLGVFYFFVIVIFIIGKLVFCFLVIINVWCNIM